MEKSLVYEIKAELAIEVIVQTRARVAGTRGQGHADLGIFIDRFDRRTAVLVVYAGFTVGTLSCGLGHFAIIPLMAQYFVANVGLPEDRVFLVYLIGGVLTVFTAPRIGRLADRFGRVRVLAVGVSFLRWPCRVWFAREISRCR